MLKNKKYSQFIYFAGGLEGGAEKPEEKAPEAAKEQRAENPEAAKADAQKKAEAMTGSAKEGLTELSKSKEKGTEFKLTPEALQKKLDGKIDDQAAYEIYTDGVDPIRKAVEFFKSKEGNDENRAKLEAAYRAAGGSLEGVAAQSTKPSNLLYSGPERAAGQEIGLGKIDEMIQGDDAVQGVLNVKKSGKWNRFSLNLVETYTMATKAIKAYETA